MIDYVVPIWMYPVLFWTLVWKGVAGWKAARRGHLSWFIVFLFLNTFGILPILYYFFLDKIKFYSVDDKHIIRKTIKSKSSFSHKGVPSKSRTTVLSSSGKKPVKKNKIPTLA